VPSILRDRVLTGVSVVAAGAPDVAAACAALGAEVDHLEVDPFGDEPALEVADGVVIVWDGAGAFAAHEGVQATRAALDGAWLAIRRAGTVRDAKLILLAPPPGSPHAEAARAGLENLARVLGIEWARFNTRVVAILPATATPPDLVAYLASPAGDYFSGCALTLA
jgi:NAD(P)-dependent dehydrogenase (short-subunit alcohol dehydrogenase family)